MVSFHVPARSIRGWETPETSLGNGMIVGLGHAALAGAFPAAAEEFPGSPPGFAKALASLASHMEESAELPSFTNSLRLIMAGSSVICFKTFCSRLQRGSLTEREAVLPGGEQFE